jgi:AcrR family transcriptional regulator
MPKPTFLKLPAGKRKRVIDAALQEFGSKRYRNASLSGIVAAAGVSKGSLYQYFDNKLDLFSWLVLEHAVQAKVRFLDAHPAPDGSDLFATLEHQLHVGTRFALANPRLARMGDRLYESTGDPELQPLFKNAREVGIAYMAKTIEQAQARGEVRPELSPRLAASLVMAALREGTQGALADRLGVTLMGWVATPELHAKFPDHEREALVHELVDFLRYGLAPR